MLHLPHQSRKFPVPLDRNENYQNSGMLVSDPQRRNDLDDGSWQQKSPFNRNVMRQNRNEQCFVTVSCAGDSFSIRFKNEMIRRNWSIFLFFTVETLSENFMKELDVC